MEKDSLKGNNTAEVTQSKQLVKARHIMFDAHKSIVDLIKEGLMTGIISEDVNQLTATPVISEDSVIIRFYKRIYINNDDVVADIELLNSAKFAKDGKKSVISEDKGLLLKEQFDLSQFLYEFSFNQQFKQ